MLLSCFNKVQQNPTKLAVVMLKCCQKGASSASKQVIKVLDLLRFSLHSICLIRFFFTPLTDLLQLCEYPNLTKEKLE